MWVMAFRSVLVGGLLILGFAVAGGSIPDATAGAPAQVAAARADADKRLAAIPREAWDVLDEIQARHGEPPPGYVGGRVFQNREGRLPRGSYREYDVHPKLAGRPRDGARIVIDQRTGRAYYTGDHYRTFQPMVGR